MAIVINIKPEHEAILGFLYPTHALLKPGDAPSGKFIIRRDITSKVQRDALDVYYDKDSIFISNQIFDEFWDEDIIKAKCVEYAHGVMHNRKSKFETTKDTFLEDCVNFMVGSTTEAEEESINALFDAFGSKLFIPLFLKLSDTIPVAKLQASMNTFVSKILQVNESSSVFYKKKAMVLAPKIRKNLLRAVDEYTQRDNDNYGLSIVKFYSDLFV